MIAIILQSAWTIVVALSGRYEQILNYVVSMDFLFFGLTGASLFVFRRREAATTELATRISRTRPSLAQLPSSCWYRGWW